MTHRSAFSDNIFFLLVFGFVILMGLLVEKKHFVTIAEIIHLGSN